MRVFFTIAGLFVLGIATIGLFVAGGESDAGERMTGFIGVGAGALIGIGLMIGAVAYRPLYPPVRPQPPQPNPYQPGYMPYPPTQ
jgi:hypothetical protein